jgi:acyl dehydratase
MPASTGEGIAGSGQTKPRPASSRRPDPPALRLDRRVTQELIDAYADASGDHNPIHVNPEVAQAVGLGGTIAHGMLSMAFAGQLLTGWLSRLPERGGWISRLRVRFQAMVRPGDTLSCFGDPGARDDHQQPVDLWIENQRDERVITGDAQVTFPVV